MLKMGLCHFAILMLRDHTGAAMATLAAAACSISNMMPTEKTLPQVAHDLFSTLSRTIAKNMATMLMNRKRKKAPICHACT